MICFLFPRSLRFIVWGNYVILWLAFVHIWSLKSVTMIPCRKLKSENSFRVISYGILRLYEGKSWLCRLTAWPACWTHPLHNWSIGVTQPTCAIQKATLHAPRPSRLVDVLFVSVRRIGEKMLPHIMMIATTSKNKTRKNFHHKRGLQETTRDISVQRIQ